MTALLVLAVLAVLALVAFVAALAGGALLIALFLDHPIACILIVLLVVWIV